MTPFQDAVAAALERVGPGEVITYGELAAEAGRPGGARGVASALRALDAPAWWRVVPASGRLAHRPQEAARRLRAEGVEVTPEGRVRPAARG